MRTLTLIIWSIILMHSPTVLANHLTIKITKIKPEKGGQLLVMAFTKDGYPKQHDKAIQIQTIETLNPEVSVDFVLPVDNIAIKVLHDEDRNGKVTKNWTGIWPREGLGFSNNQKISLKGVPKYENSMVMLNKGTNQHTIEIEYP